MNFALRRLRPLVLPVAWLLALSCVAGVAATLFWRLAAPPAIDRPLSHDSDPRTAAQRIAGQRPFAGQTPPGTAPLAVTTSGAFSLVGVATGFVGGQGFALLKSGGQEPEAFVEGEEIATGVRLKRILADGVEIERGGRLEHIALPSTPTAGVLPVEPEPPVGQQIEPLLEAATQPANDATTDTATDAATETLIAPAESATPGLAPKDN